MQTKIKKIKNIAEQRATIEEAGELIRRGELVAFPTETVYGLGANGFDPKAAAKIYAVKGRPSDNPLILHVSSRAMIDTAAIVNETAEKLLTIFCPGPLTLILPKTQAVPSEVTGNLPTVGIRCPDNSVARALIAAADVPIAAPSANLSGRPSPTTALMTAEDLDGKIPLILDGGATQVGLESTIVDCTSETATILRPGAITREMLAEVLGDVRVDPGLTSSDQAPKAPGMKYRHYAPRAPLTIVTGEASEMGEIFCRRVTELKSAGKTVGVLASRETCAALSGALPAELLFNYGERGNLPQIAANLYAGLSYFDRTAADCLLAESVDAVGLGAAIMNRLGKAAGKN